MKTKVKTVSLVGGYLVSYEYVTSEKDITFKPDGKDSYTLNIDEMTIVDHLNKDIQKIHNSDSADVFEVISSYIQRYVYPTDFRLDNDYNPIDYLPRRKEGYCEEKTNI